MRLRVYRVYDTQNDEYWSSDHGKTLWLRPADAKNSWNTHKHRFSELRRWNVPVFNQQERFILAKFVVSFKEYIDHVDSRQYGRQLTMSGVQVTGQR